jgi:hypothetical protein
MGIMGLVRGAGDSRIVDGIVECTVKAGVGIIWWERAMG